MMNTTNATFKPTTKLRQLLGGYRKNKAILYVRNADEPVTQQFASYWDSGSKDNFLVLDLQTGLTSIPFGGSYSKHFSDSTSTVHPGQVILQTGTLMGKEATCYIYVFPSDLERFKSMEFVS